MPFSILVAEAVSLSAARTLYSQFVFEVVRYCFFTLFSVDEFSTPQRIHAPHFPHAIDFLSDDRRCSLRVPDSRVPHARTGISVEADVSRFRSQHISRGRCATHSAQNLFIRRLLAQRSAGSQAKQLGREETLPAGAEIWLPTPV